MRRFMAAACLLAVCAVAGTLHAAPIFECSDGPGHIAFQDTPCAVRANQRKLDVQPLPTVGDPAEVARHVRAQTARDRHAPRPSRHARRPRATRRHARTPAKMSWECHAADGEVFYRHARCPSSVPGDGVVRSRYAERMPSGRGHHNAWSRVRVHGTKITRSEACRRIHSASASGRDGHLRDATVSTYDHLMGRDPCG
ncbi:MAG TPA: DUF4124 domain-containing protein [Rhodanobacteraceae bacterium]|nr:DUF4124 domain-containing protein [Rhodanobacteraceae bacterium]